VDAGAITMKHSPLSIAIVVKRQWQARNYISSKFSLEINMSFLETASKCLRCPAERVILIEDSSKFDPSSIRDGVVIIFAVWSGPAHMLLKAFTEELSHNKQDIPVWILDIDTLTNAVIEKFRGALHGNSETFFFRDGIQADQILRGDGDFRENFRLKWQHLFGSL
jgi:hypothetical protein